MTATDPFWPVVTSRKGARSTPVKNFGGAEIEVAGWVNKTTDSAKKNWISKFSDHSLLYGEIHK